MNTPLFPNGIKGLADSKWSAYEGECDKLVGIDFRSTPGIIKSHQKLTKNSGATVTELCKNKVELSDGSIIWFSSESGKIWKQVGDTFTLVHTVVPATDYKEPNSIVNGVWDNDDIESGITMSIAENNAVYGKIDDSKTVNSMIDVTGMENSACELSSGYFAIAYSGSDYDGYVKTFQLTSTYQYSEIEPLEHDTTKGRYSSICKIDGTHFMVAYEGGASNQGYIKTFTANYGSLTQTNSLMYDATDAEYNSLIQIDATHYALAYAGGASDYGYIKIFTIDGAFAITETSQLIHDSSGSTYGHKLIKIDATHFMLAYATQTTTQKIKIFTIDGAYAITETSSLTHSTTGNIYQGLIQLDATHYAWSGMIGVRGYLKIFTIDGSYNITETSNLDIKSYNYFPALLKTDETHIVLSSSHATEGYTKVFEITPTTYVIREVSSSYLAGGVECSMIKSGRRILTIHTNGSSNYVTVAAMNETYSNGIILKPSGTSDIKLITSKMVAQITTIEPYLRATIDIPPGYSNLDVVVITGRAGDETYPPTGATIEGNAMTEICNRTTTSGFKASSAIYNYINPTVGENDIVVSFGTNPYYGYAIVLVFANVHQTTAYSATVDYGWQDYLELPGATNGELRVGAFLSKINTHHGGDLQTQIGSIDIADDTHRYTASVGLREFSIGTAKTLGAADFTYTQTEEQGTEDNSYIPEEQKEKIYYCNEDVLFAIPVDKISSWATDVETIGVFKNGDDTYHHMVKQNLELYIGDKIVIAKVNVNGEFIQETSLNVMSPERIQVLCPYDTDILIGTKIVNKARVLRWDTFSDSWIADDDIIETGINAFILDDDYTYVSAGEYGHLYFYNGEKLNITKKIPGDWDSTHTAKINANAAGYLKGTPVFGLSNITGNPTLQGIYGFGGYDSKYPKSLSLDFPMPTNEFSGIEIGAININGANMYVSYKTATDVGIAKLDHSNKYNNAYLETALLDSLKERDDYSIYEGICIDYALLPANTAASIEVKTKYQSNYSTQDQVVDPDKLSIKTKSNIPDVLNLQVKVNLTSSGNNCPLIENIGIL